MKGLLIKDFRLMATQKSFFAIIIVVMFCVTMATDNPYFVVGYVSFVFSLFTISTISYDEFDNGLAFLFTLPVTRKEYALEKYVYGLLLGGIAWFCAAMATLVYQLVTVPEFLGAEWLAGAAFMIVFIVLIPSVMVPLVLKFGGDKARIVSMVFAGALVAIVFVLNTVFDSLHLDLGEGLNQVFSAMNTGVLLGIVFVVLIVILLISIKISVRVMEKKEL